MVLNVVDEIINGTPKYNITENGDGTKEIELANEIVQEGTLLNKNIFNKIENVLSYQTPTYITEEETLSYDTSEFLSTNQSDWNESGIYKQEATTNTPLGEFMSFSDTTNQTYSAFKAFDDNTSTYTIIKNNSSSFFGFTDRKVIYKKIKLYINSYQNTIVEVQGYNRATGELESLKQETVSGQQLYEIDLNNNKEFQGIKLNSVVSTFNLSELHLLFDINTKKYMYELGTIGTTLADNQIILLHTPNVEDLVHSATLNGIDIDTQLKANSYYELVYNETQNKFIAEEVRNAN